MMIMMTMTTKDDNDDDVDHNYTKDTAVVIPRVLCCTCILILAGQTIYIYMYYSALLPFAFAILLLNLREVDVLNTSIDF